jgi:hypothetical protein
MEVLVKASLFAALATASLLSALPALADDRAPPAPGTYRAPEQIVYGRPNRPMVLIDIRAVSSTAAAGAAHEVLRTALVNRSEPAAMRPSR